METEVLKEQHYVEELVEIIRSGLPKEELIDRLRRSSRTYMTRSRT